MQHPGYEKKDASAGWIFAVVAMLAISGIGIHLLLGLYLRHLNGTEAPKDGWQPASRSRYAGAVQAFSKLQVAPQSDLAAFRAREEARLNSYGWINKSSGIVHIPITNAIELLLERGLASENGNTPGPTTYGLQLKRVEEQNTRGVQR